MGMYEVVLNGPVFPLLGTLCGRAYAVVTKAMKEGSNWKGIIMMALGMSEIGLWVLILMNEGMGLRTDEGAALVGMARHLY